MKNLKKWDRHSLLSLSMGTDGDPRGNILLSPRGQVNVSDFKILASTVDTIRQLYSGKMNPELLVTLDDVYQQGPGSTWVDPLGNLFSVGGAMVGGYKYKLQSNDLGLIILLKHRHHTPDVSASHLKIELSPKLIQSMGVVQIQSYLDSIAAQWLQSPQPAGCAVHMALDVQGWQPSSSFIHNFVCRSKRVTTSHGISDFTVDSGEIASVYGHGQSMLFGTSRAMQCAIYNKTREALARDKLDFWESIWSTAPGDDPFTSAYDPDQDVWRVELRFHQSVIREYAAGEIDLKKCEYISQETGEVIGTDPHLMRWLDIVPHLTSLWRTSTLSFRLDHSPGLIDPYWQCINEDPVYFDNLEPIHMKRVRKQPGRGNEKNIGLALGNLISLYARQGFTQEKALECLCHSGIWGEIQAYYQRRGLELWQLNDLIGKKLTERRLLGRAA